MRTYKTQMEAARRGIVTEELKKAAEKEQMTPEELMRETGLSMKVIQDAVRMSGYKIEDIEYAEDGI